MTINEVLWILCGVALVAMALIAMFFGSDTRTRALDDIYARRDQRLGLRTASSAADDVAPVTSSAPTAPAARPLTA